VNSRSIDRSHAYGPFGNADGDRVHLWQLQHAGCDPVREGFDQADRFALDDILRDCAEQPVIDRILHAIGLSWGHQVGLHLDVNLEVLGTRTLSGTNSMAPAEGHPRENNPVHPAIVAWRTPGHAEPETGNNRMVKKTNFPAPL
jgi:hypothetical protein